VVAGPHGEGAGNFTAQVGYAALNVRHLQKDMACAGQQLSARLGQRDPASYPVEQAGPCLLLEGGDPLADRGLGQIELFRGAGERFHFGHADKGLQLTEFHTSILQ